MKFNFKKISAVVSSLLLAGMAFGTAATISPPSAFATGAVVMGTGANDAVAESTLTTYLNQFLFSETETVGMEGGESIFEDEIILGGEINKSTYDIRAEVTSGTSKGKIPTLFDDKITWDDGTGSSNYRMEERLYVGGMELKTSFDDDRAEGVFLTNDQKLAYRLIFKDTLNNSAVGTTDADTLYLSILGNEYEIESMTNTSITVVTSKEYNIGKGDSIVVSGKTFTVTDIFSGSVFVNEQNIADGGTKKIDGMRVKVESIGYHSNDPTASRAILRIGDDISKAYNDGDEYIGEDEDDPTWVWELSDVGYTDGYIGVKYNKRERLPTHDIVYEGASYIFPENFAEVKFVGTTDVSYEEFKVYFVEKLNLWNSTSTSSTETISDAPVLVIEGPTTTSIVLDNGDEETNKIYLRWAKNGSETQTARPEGALEIFQRDVSGAVQTAIKDRYVAQINSTENDTATVASTKIGKLVNGDTEMYIYVQVASGALTVKFEDQFTGVKQNLTLTVGGDLLNQTQGSIEWLGGFVESTSSGVAEATDVILASTNLGVKEKDIMSYAGIIVKDVKANAESDEVIIHVPNDQLFGHVSITAGGEVVTTTPGTTGVLVFKDTEKTAFAGKNIIVVGGSCINRIAAELLEIDFGTCAAEFTEATGIGAGEYMVEQYSYGGKTAILVAGYEAAETAAAANLLVSGDAVSGQIKTIGTI